LNNSPVLPSTLNTVDPVDVPTICRFADGVIVPIPTFDPVT
jgi:hypothetical protein